MKSAVTAGLLSCLLSSRQNLAAVRAGVAMSIFMI